MKITAMILVIAAISLIYLSVTGKIETVWHTILDGLQSGNATSKAHVGGAIVMLLLVVMIGSQVPRLGKLIVVIVGGFAFILWIRVLEAHSKGNKGTA